MEQALRWCVSAVAIAGGLWFGDYHAHRWWQLCQAAALVVQRGAGCAGAALVVRDW